MPDVPRPPPTAEKKREYKKLNTIGRFIQKCHDGTPPEEGVTRIVLAVPERSLRLMWDKALRRYRYRRNSVDARGRKIGGQFAEAPKDAPSERRRKGPKRKKKEKAPR